MAERTTDAGVPHGPDLEWRLRLRLALYGSAGIHIRRDAEGNVVVEEIPPERFAPRSGETAIEAAARVILEKSR